MSATGGDIGILTRGYGRLKEGASSTMITGLILAILEGLFSAFTWCVLIFFRYRFGERAFSIIWVIASAILIIAFYSILGFFTADVFAQLGIMERDFMYNVTEGQSAMLFHLKLFILVSLGHLAHMWYRTRIEDENWYSRSRGLSGIYSIAKKFGIHNRPIRLNGKTILTIRQHSFWLYVEPAIVIFFSIIAMSINKYYGMFLLFCGFSFLIREYMEFMKVRSKILNIKDGDIESEFLSELVDKGTVGEGTVEEAKGYDDYGAIFQRDKTATENQFIVSSPTTYKGYKLYKLTPEELNSK